MMSFPGNELSFLGEMLSDPGNALMFGGGAVVATTTTVQWVDAGHNVAREEAKSVDPSGQRASQTDLLIITVNLVASIMSYPLSTKTLRKSKLICRPSSFSVYPVYSVFRLS